MLTIQTSRQRWDVHGAAVLGAAQRGRVRAGEAQAGVLQHGGELVLLTGEAAEGVFWGGTAQDSRVVHGVSGPLSNCVWNLQVFPDDARGCQ